MKTLVVALFPLVQILVVSCAHESDLRSPDPLLLVGTKAVFKAESFDHQDVARQVNGYAEVELIHVSASNGIHELKFTIDNQSTHPLICVYRLGTNHWNYIFTSQVIETGSSHEIECTYDDPDVDLFPDPSDVDPFLKEGMVLLSCIKTIPVDLSHLETIDAMELMKSPEKYNNRYLKIRGLLSFRFGKCGFYQMEPTNAEYSIPYVPIYSNNFPLTPTDTEILSIVTGFFTFHPASKDCEISNISSVEFFPGKGARDGK